MGVSQGQVQRRNGLTAMRQVCKASEMSIGRVYHSQDSEAMRLLARETRVRYGHVPRDLDGLAVEAGAHRISTNAFLLRTDEGLNYLYRKGEGITIEREPGCDSSDEALWLNGSVYTAVACINGLKPIHASAVAFEGKVHAFAGPSGAGKSTLVAALGARGLPMFCDDTLVLDLSEPEDVICLPGHKRLKLSSEAIALSEAEQEEIVSATVSKFYARPAAGDVNVALPLASLTYLEEGPEMRLEPITGAQRMARLTDDHYTERFFSIASNTDLAGQFNLRTRLAKQICMVRFARPMNRAHFSESVDFALRLVMGMESRAI